MSVSEGYVELTTPEAVDEARARLADAWKDPSIPRQQRDLADRELVAWKAGGECPPFDAFVWALKSVLTAEGGDGRRRSLIDVGCASGYYFRVMRIFGLDVDFAYCGVDYSPAMIDLAMETWYGGTPAEVATLHRRVANDAEPLGPYFDVADALALPCADASFDVVVSGCYLLHLGPDDWRAAIREAARVSRRWVVFHRTPLLYSGPTRYFTKRAYGVECLEMHLAVSEFRAALADAGLRVRFERQIARTGEHANETWVCERISI